MACLSAYMPNLQISKCTDNTPKTQYGGNCPPPPLPLATLVHFSHCHNRFDTIYIIVYLFCILCKFNAGCLNAYTCYCMAI